ncbi:MAG: PIN domain-containing protein [Actinomycetota bacterium]|nr:PIN domain-containing protein [Actinomycetota bacterium]
MPTRGRRADVVVDTSAAVALVQADHEHHARTMVVLGDRRLGLSGHAAFETYSVLTRLPPPLRRRPAEVVDLLADNFPAGVSLSPERAAGLVPRLAELGIAGGSVYDALVGAAAAERGIPLATWDVRAVDTYRALGVEVELLAER